MSMNEQEDHDRQTIDEIRGLVHRSFDEALPAADVRKLECALSSSAEVRRWYAQRVQLHADLSTTCGAYEVCKYIQEEFPEDQIATSELGVGNASPGSPDVVRHQSWFLRRHWISNYAAAALILMGIGLGCGVTLFASNVLRVNRTFVPLPWNWSVANEVVARMVTTHGAKWQPSQFPETLPTRGLRAGQKIRLAEGTITLSFRSGVTVIVEGPAIFEMRSEDGGKLYGGRLLVNVPSDVDAFQVEVHSGRLQLGPGEFGIEIDKLNGPQNSEVHVFSGLAPGVESALYVSSFGEQTLIRDGQAMLFSGDGKARPVALASYDRFPRPAPIVTPEPFRGDVIFLGNLFDSCRSTSLTDAVETDEYQAAGETINLGVAAVRDGGLDVDVSLAEDGVTFNLLNVGGGGPAVSGLPGNDTYRSNSTIPIRTTGEDFGTPGPLPKVEEGIGMSSNELLTFDLREIREAGKLGERAMRFVVDRAGINDREDPLQDSRETASVNLVVVVSTEERVIAGYVNGKRYDVTERDGVYSFDVDGTELPPPLRYDGRFVSFDVPIAPEARFLTLAATMVDQEHHDHGVFSGARLELMGQSTQSPNSEVTQ